MSHLDILLPFALPPAPLAADLLKQLHLPALATLTSRTRSRRAETRQENFDSFQRALPHETWLTAQFGLEEKMQQSGSPPVAPALMHEFGLTTNDGAWFIVQPVYIHIARDHLVLADPRQLMLAEQQARVLFDIAKPLFDEVGLDLIYANSDLWFLRADDWGELQTSSPDAASGHNIDIWMPKGPRERDWRKIQNEVQMHWHEHPVNQERERQGFKPVNSLWLWGGAAAATRPTGAYDDVFNLSGWTQAFRQAAGKARATDASAAGILAAKPDRALILLDTLMEAALADDWSQWLQHMHALETDWFAPMLAALKDGRVDHVSLVLTHESRLSCFDASRSSLKKFWIKPSLAALQS